ncbi:MAG TPA: hypothetical protein VHB50_01755 [Bryobacteraceae bacterium]|nr:hypothetical protein [Bryobacteraceae bacterium]
MQAQFEAGIARLPRWILLLGAIGTVVSLSFLGVAAAGGFLTGAIAAYANLRLIERVVNGVARAAGRIVAEPDADRPGTGTGVWVLIQLTGLVAVAFVIIKYSGFNLAAAFCGFLVCPAAAVLEIVYELVTYDHS